MYIFIYFKEFVNFDWIHDTFDIYEKRDKYQNWVNSSIYIQTSELSRY